MKKLLLSLNNLLIILAFTASAIAQKAPEYENNLYYKALSAYLEKRTKTYGKIDVIVEADPHLTANFPNLISGITVRFLNYGELRAEYKKQGKDLLVFVPQPMKNEGDRLVIGFTEHSVGFNKKGSVYSLSDGCRIEFVYDCEKREFVIDKVELWGI
jgi:hypothetical protein